MFSAMALAEAVDFDEHLDYLLEFFRGDVLSWEAPHGISGGYEIENGLHIKRIDARYIVETDKDSYLCLFVDYPVEQIHPDCKGLYSLCVVQKDDENAGTFRFKDSTENPGIYKPDPAVKTEEG